MNIKQSNLPALFNEWAKRYSENPDIYGQVLDSNGKPISNYGELCSEYLKKLNRELFSSNGS